MKSEQSHVYSSLVRSVQWINRELVRGKLSEVLNINQACHAIREKNLQLSIQMKLITSFCYCRFAYVHPTHKLQFASRNNLAIPFLEKMMTIPEIKAVLRTNISIKCKCSLGLRKISKFYSVIP